MWNRGLYHVSSPFGRTFFSMRKFSSELSKEISDRTIQPTKRRDFAKKHITPGVGRLLDIELVSGSGSWVTDSNGRRFLDFGCGIAVTNLGHCHPRVTKKAQEQMGTLVHAQVNISWHKPMLDLIERLTTIMHPSLDRFFFWNSGAEAVEASIKLARNTTKKQNIIVFQGGYHGRTFGTMSMTTSKTIYRGGFGPLLSGIFVAPYPYCLHCVAYKSESACCNDPIRQIELMLKQQTTPEETAAILLEPILGEGGYVVPPPGFLEQLRKLCDKHNILLIFDEVQTGFGRTGKYFAYEHFGVVPDILIFAKGIANGLPLSGIASRFDIMESQMPGSMGGTYAGNAVACAAACEVIDVMKEEEILENVQERASELTRGLRELQRKFPAILDIRGKGLMIGLEFDQKKVSPHFTKQLSDACAERGVILLSASIYPTMRLMPPLTLSSSEASFALNVLDEALTACLPSH